MKKLIILCISMIFLFSVNAQDTFSICAVDLATGEVGSAGASCVDGDDTPGGAGVIILSDLLPGIGVINTQAYWRSENQDYAHSLMILGISPQQIIDSLIANDIDGDPSLRQYGIVDLHADSARSVAYTGESCFDYKGHITKVYYSIQGNTLLGKEILDSMEARFLNAKGELACRLMAALQGAKVVGADTRCSQYNTSSLGAFLTVAKPDDPENDVYLEINVPKVLPGIDPIDSLQTLVNDWGGCGSSGITDYKKSKFVEVFPNPAIQMVTFKFITNQLNSETDIIIFNSLGQIVHQFKHIQTYEVSWEVESLPEGIYFYKLVSNGKLTSTGKLIIE